MTPEGISDDLNVERFLATPEGQERKAHIDGRSTTLNHLRGLGVG